jgi:hypothetical protein
MPSSDSLLVPPSEVLAVDTSNDYQLLQDIDGGPPGGRCRRVWQRLPPSFEDDINGRPPGGAVGGSDSVHH